MTSLAFLVPGTFVTIEAPEHVGLGVGKMVSVREGVAVVQYFDGPGAPLPAAIECPAERVRPARLPAQTRVYRRLAGGRWQCGRVLEADATAVFVQFPNNETVTLRTDEVFVRWRRPLVDPLPLLIAEATESPFLADARSAFVREVSLQRTAAAGVTALLSASVELVDYQFDVVRRVLTDPVQRYLLADEVGLGKTIEAGTILRQYFLDEPEDARAVVLVPAALVRQWRDELSMRFGLGDFLDDQLLVLGHGEHPALAREAASLGMLVVDEAHHLSREGDEASSRLYELLREHASLVPRLLLLSATPVLGDEAGFLRVLHLLDPLVFPLDDLEGFRRRIASRQLVAEVVGNLSADNRWGLEPELEQLEQAWGDDAELTARVAALREVLATFPEEDDERFLTALADLRVHLVESYRLHRRMLRNRRGSVSWATPRRAGATREPLRCALAARMRDDLERLRLMLDPALGPALAAPLMQAAVHARVPTRLGPLLQQHVPGQAEALDLAQTIDALSQRLRQAPERFEALRALVERLVAQPKVQVVVFCDQPEDADRAVALLGDALPGAVQRHEIAGVDDSASRALPWQAFLDNPERCRVLVCDARAEEGVNLHGGRKVAVHFDLPLSPNRIEQRMGRLDRFGRGDRVASVVLVDEACPDEGLWADVLASGWKVFDRSVASLQYLIESASRTLAVDWMRLGSEALSAHASTLGGPDGLVQREIRQIDAQDRLDSIGEVAPDAIDALDERDAEWRPWQQAFRGFAINALGFAQRFEDEARAPGEQDPVFRVGYVRSDGPHPTLMPLSNFVGNFMQSVDMNARGGGSRLPLTHRYVFRRQHALSRAALASAVHLMRVGDPLVTALERFCEIDDRGRAFALWRVDREYQPSDPSGADLFLRFDFVVRPAEPQTPVVPEGAQPPSAHALARKTGTFMQPLAITVWVDGAGNVLEHPPEILTAPYRDRWTGSRRDFNLNPRRWRVLPALVRSTWLRDWPQLCARNREQAEAAVETSTAWREHVGRAVAVCVEEGRLRHAQGASRLVRLEGTARVREVEEMGRDEAAYGAMRAALAHPRLDLDIVGAVFLAAETLDGD